MTALIRRAEATDLPAMLDLAEQRRVEYARYQPRFWNPAPDARLAQSGYFAQLFEAPEVLTAVCLHDAQLSGFLIARLVPAPPVYQPGGLTCLIDDFCLAAPQGWTTLGRQLLEHIYAQARQRGATQAVVVCGHLDQPKREMLFATGATLASEWFVQEL
jgi:GNAT superfamily N-acetyltransferase